MQSEQISIIIPMYNAEKQIQKCIDSLLGQTYGNFEIIIVNDGSKDKSLDVCKEAYGGDSRVNIIDKPNGGVSDARNAGMRAASGEYVTFVDADDWVDSTYLSCLHDNLVQNNVDICTLDYKIVASDPARTIKNNTDKKEVLSSHTALERFFDAKIPTFACAKLYRREVIEGLEFPLGIKIGEDALFVYHALQRANTVCILPDRLYNYWLDNTGSATNNFFRRYDYNTPHFATLILNDLKETTPDLLRKASNFLLSPVVRSFFGYIANKKDSLPYFKDLYKTLQTIFCHADHTKSYYKYKLFFALYKSYIFRPVCRLRAAQAIKRL
ncbi:MAG: glycosyltransferase [Clostridiales bacterium]|nr:glycosyltransferase [Clostridiales bacterium]